MKNVKISLRQHVSWIGPIKYQSTNPLPHLDQQRLLLPQHKGPLVQPRPRALLVQLELEIPQHLGQKEPHLRVGQILTYAVSGTDGERLRDGKVVVGELFGS